MSNTSIAATVYSQPQTRTDSFYLADTSNLIQETRNSLNLSPRLHDGKYWNFNSFISSQVQYVDNPSPEIGQPEDGTPSFDTTPKPPCADCPPGSYILQEQSLNWSDPVETPPEPSDLTAICTVKHDTNWVLSASQYPDYQGPTSVNFTDTSIATAPTNKINKIYSRTVVRTATCPCEVPSANCSHFGDYAVGSASAPCLDLYGNGSYQIYDTFYSYGEETDDGSGNIVRVNNPAGLSCENCFKTAQCEDFGESAVVITCEDGESLEERIHYVGEQSPDGSVVYPSDMTCWACY